MITFKAIIIPNNRRKDGTYPVKIRVTFKGVSRRLPTTLVCKSQDLTRGNKIKNADILSKSDDLINRMRAAVRDISPFDLENWDVDRIVGHIKDQMTGESFHLDFFEWSDQFLKTKTDTTREAYDFVVNSFERFLGQRSIDINSITKTMLMDYADFIEQSPKIHTNKATGKQTECKVKKVSGASTRYLMKLQHIFNAAKDKYNDEDCGRILIPRSPFSKIPKTASMHDGQKSLGQELMQKIISYKTDDTSMRQALDIFIVSFALMGANMADLYIARPVKDIWIYNRQKTKTRRADKAEMRVKVPGEIDAYIKRLQDGSSSYWLPVLHNLSDDTDACTARVNRLLKKWCKDNEVSDFTFYAARHTWATLARKAGVEKATIDECLVHKGTFGVTDIYAERSWDLIQEANRKVIEMFTW